MKPPPSIAVPDYYGEELNYDKNGNIIKLNRNGDTDTALTAMAIDKLGYGYELNTNKLIKVSDNFGFSGFKDGANTTVEYGYDLNGNMTRDDNKLIGVINYNNLDLPNLIKFNNGNNITYLYNAKGQKLKKVINVITPASTTITEYLDGFQYKGGILQMFPTTEGYVNVIGGSAFKYVFQYKDHLDNVRSSYSDNVLGNGTIEPNEIIEQSNYYPFGLKQNGYNTTVSGGNPDGQKYKYNGKELQEELGLNVYDYGARNYDHSIGRFFSLDPKAEEYYNQNCYAISVNNPVFFIDINGEGVLTDFIVLKTGEDKGKIVRADVNDGSEKNKTDRILQTDKKNNVNKDKDGNSTAVIDNIHKGIITEGMNMRNGNAKIEYGGVDQATEKEVVDFITKFSEKIANVEISGFETVNKNNNQKTLYTEPYKNNSLYESFSLSYPINRVINGSLIVKAHFHSHPDSPIASDDGIDKPSDADINGRNIRKLKGMDVELPHYIYNKNGRHKY